jgi:hypothetical protein
MYLTRLLANILLYIIRYQELFINSSFWGKVFRYTMFFQFAMVVLSLTKAFGEGGFSNITMGSFLYSLAVTVPLSFFTALIVCLYERSKHKHDV